MKILDIGLDEIEEAQLLQFARLNNISIEQAAALLIQDRLNEWADSITEDTGREGVKH